MESLLNNLFGGAKSSATPIPSADSDFVDFAEAAEPSPAPISPALKGGATLGTNAAAATDRPFTKWYRLDERYTLNDFRAEGLILIVIAVILGVHLIGTRLNRNKARKWAKAHAKPLATEFALVGFGGIPSVKEGDELVKELAATNQANAERTLREKSLFEYATYATGRQNVAFVDVKLTLIRRFNPFVSLIEAGVGLFFDSVPAPEDSMQAIAYPFDGKEAATVPAIPGTHELRSKENKSTFDGFVWALVNKERMKQVRDDRYDVSITSTRDHSKLPNWLTIMSESAEITDVLLTPELIKAAESAGDALDYLIVSDQPTDKPTTIDETAPRKRIFLKYRLPSDNNYDNLVPIFTYFLRLSDQLVKEAHFRPEVTRKLKNVREDAIKQLQKVGLEEKNEERALEREKARKQKRDQELAALDAKGQKRYLEKEREKEIRKSQKKGTVRA